LPQQAGRNSLAITAELANAQALLSASSLLVTLDAEVAVKDWFGYVPSAGNPSLL
jgi:hypothetical protein